METSSLILGFGKAPQGGRVARLPTYQAALEFDTTRRGELLAKNDLNIDGGITNAGTILATSVTNGSGVVSGGIGILVGASDEDHAAGGLGVTIGTFTAAGAGISNSGTITGAQDIVVGGTARNSSTITIANFASGIANSGLLSATGSAIVVGGKGLNGGTVTISTFSGGIGNSGHITAANAGILVGNSSGQVAISTFTGGIANSGTINAATGIAVQNVTIAGGITDSGVISASAIGIAIGARGAVTSTHTAIKVSGPTFAGGITNAGTLSAAAAGILVSGATTFGGGIFNSGLIDPKTGIRVVSVSTFAGGISNGGAIAATHSGVFANLVGTFTGGIANSGTISAGSSAAAAAFPSTA